jgi:hypothetical protein
LDKSLPNNQLHLLFEPFHRHIILLPNQKLLLPNKKDKLLLPNPMNKVLMPLHGDKVLNPKGVLSNPMNKVLMPLHGDKVLNPIGVFPNHTLIILLPITVPVRRKMPTSHHELVLNSMEVPIQMATILPRKVRTLKRRFPIQMASLLPPKAILHLLPTVVVHIMLLMEELQIRSAEVPNRNPKLIPKALPQKPKEITKSMDILNAKLDKILTKRIKMLSTNPNPMCVSLS